VEVYNVGSRLFDHDDLLSAITVDVETKWLWFPEPGMSTPLRLAGHNRTDFRVTGDPDRWHCNMVCSFVEILVPRRLNKLVTVRESTQLSLQDLMEGRRTNKAQTIVAADYEWPPLLSTHEFLMVLERLLRVVVHLFDHGVVHRDINPANVMVAGLPETPDAGIDVDGTPTMVKLGNFMESFDREGLRQKDFMMRFDTDETTPRGGSHNLRPPEVANALPGTKIDFSKTDVFGVGMVALAMLTSSRDPVSDPKYWEESTATLHSTCPEDVVNLVTGMLDSKFDTRFTASVALAKVLELSDSSFTWQ
jgi:serine/threonine protein kinase